MDPLTLAAARLASQTIDSVIIETAIAGNVEDTIKSLRLIFNDGKADKLFEEVNGRPPTPDEKGGAEDLLDFLAPFVADINKALEDGYAAGRLRTFIVKGLRQSVAANVMAAVLEVPGETLRNSAACAEEIEDSDYAVIAKYAPDLIAFVVAAEREVLEDTNPDVESFLRDLFGEGGE